MPWLADLVESNDSSLDVLPVQCLCEFLLHDAPSDTSASLSTGDDASQTERHKKQVSSYDDVIIIVPVAVSRVPLSVRLVCSVKQSINHRS